MRTLVGIANPSVRNMRTFVDIANAFNAFPNDIQEEE
jgi:hypothetical protein